jgi:hypothetical protein
MYCIFSVCVCVCVFNDYYVACKAHALYHIVICDLPGSTIFFSRYLINGSVLKKKVIEYKTCVLGISTTFIRNISNSKNNLAR